MEDTRSPGEPNAFELTRFDPDFKPMYALTEAQHQLIINQLANLVFATIEQFKHSGQGQTAQQLSAHAHDIVRDYDDDMAEIMLMSGQPSPHRLQQANAPGKHHP